MKTRLVLLALSVLLLASCGEKKKDDDRTASGQVLKGTITDSELPLGTVTSQPPLVKSVPKAASAGAEEDGDAAEAADLDAEQPEAEGETG